MAALLCAIAWVCPVARALEPLPAPELVSLGATLQTTDVVLIRGDARGRPAQVTVVTRSAAAPDELRQAVLRPEGRRAPALHGTAQRRGGGVDYTWRLSYLMGSLAGSERLQVAADGAVEGTTADGATRWDFVAAPEGGTVLVLHADGAARLGGVLERLGRPPQVETGLTVLARLVMARAVRAQAEAGRAPVEISRDGEGAPGAAGYQRLLLRGEVGLVPREVGGAQPTGVVARVRARPEGLLEVLQAPAGWAPGATGLSRTMPVYRADGEDAVELEWAWPLLALRTVYAVQTGGQAVDLLGQSGDLRGGRLRFDVRPVAPPAASDAEAGGLSERGPVAADLVLRLRQPYERTSVLLRQLYREEPLTEAALNLSFGLGLLRGLRVRAELGQAGVIRP